MTDIVIPYKEDPGPLRYALRSLTGHKVVLVGHKPYWVKNVLHIPCGDKEGAKYKEANIFRKLLKACHDDRVSDPFIYSMDDVFFLSPPKDEQFYQGTLDDKINRIREKGFQNDYLKTMKQTKDALIKKGLPTLHYDIHGPTVIHKEKFLKLTEFNWKIDYGYGIRSLYGNVNAIEATSIADCKIDSPHLQDELEERVNGRSFFSCGDTINPNLKYFLEQKWSDVSEFELP